MENIEELIRQKENIERKLREADVKHIIEDNVAIIRGELCGSVHWTMTIHSKQNRNRRSKVITAFSDAEFFEEVKELQDNIAKAVKRAESEEKVQPMSKEVQEHYEKLASYYNGGKHESIQDTDDGK